MNVTKSIYRKGNKEYTISLNWDENTFIEGGMKIGVSASCLNIETNELEEDITVYVIVESDEEEQPILKISFNGEGDASYPLRELFEESQIIDLVPAWVFGGDLITGCLIRSGLSASVSQIISCKNSTSGIKWYIKRTKALSGCFLSALPDLTANTARKAFGCVYRVGF